MFTTVALAIVVLIGLLLAYASTRPGSIHVQRAASIKAPADRIFPLINDLHSWSSWSPWEKRDPALKRTYSGAPSGQGAVYEWEGNKQVGKPFEGHNIAEFALVPQGQSTSVTWTMDGPSRFMTKLIGVFMNMDKMIGMDFETGLANLKSIAEK